MGWDIAFLLGGLAIVYFGGEYTLKGAVGLAKALGVSPAVIGLTVVGFGTSAPELVVTVQAALADKSGLAIGNVVGSNISNILLILGIGGVIIPLTCEPSSARRDSLVMVGSALLLVGLGMYGAIEWWHGILMISALLIYLGATYIQDRRNQASREMHEAEAEELEDAPSEGWKIAAFTILGLVGLIGGADLLVTGAIGIATTFGVSEAIIGLTIVALGTSLPELAATVVAALRKHTDLAIANVMGSCVFNVLSILGITSLVETLTVEPQLQQIDLWVMLAACAAATIVLVKWAKIGRITGVLFLLGYVAYMTSIGVRVLA